MIIKKLCLIYSAADVFVIPSIEDNLPNTALESLACGTPVVGFNIGGIPDMVIENVNGLLAESKNSVDLKNKILQVINNEKTQKEMVQHARQIATNEFNDKLQAESHIKLYNNILNTKQ